MQESGIGGYHCAVRITICGIEDLGRHCDAGVSHVLSILDPDWPVPEAFGAFGEHAKLGLRFHDVIDDSNTDSSGPEPEHVADLLAFGRTLLTEPTAHLLIHCHAGVSRSTASMALILTQYRPDIRADGIFEEVLGLLGDDR